MDALEAVFNEEFMQSSNVDASHSTSCPSKLTRDLFEVFNNMFDQSSSQRASSNDPPIIQDPDNPNEGDCEGSIGNSESLPERGDEGEEEESELEGDIIQISDGEDCVDKLIEVDSRDGYLTLFDNVTNAEHTIPRSRADKAKRVLSLRLL